MQRRTPQTASLLQCRWYLQSTLSVAWHSTGFAQTFSQFWSKLSATSSLTLVSRSITTISTLLATSLRQWTQQPSPHTNGSSAILMLLEKKRTTSASLIPSASTWSSTPNQAASTSTSRAPSSGCWQILTFVFTTSPLTLMTRSLSWQNSSLA